MPRLARSVDEAERRLEHRVRERIRAAQPTAESAERHREQGDAAIAAVLDGLETARAHLERLLAAGMEVP